MLAIVIHAELSAASADAAYAFRADSLYIEVGLTVIYLATLFLYGRCGRQYCLILVFGLNGKAFFVAFRNIIRVSSNHSFYQRTVKLIWLSCFTRFLTWTLSWWSEQHVATRLAEVDSFYICTTAIEAGSTPDSGIMDADNRLFGSLSCHLEWNVVLILRLLSECVLPC